MADPDDLALSATHAPDLPDPLSRTALAVDRSPAAARSELALDATLGPAAGASVSGPLRTSRIGRHAILRQLGAGGMGVVFAAYDEELDRKVALKLLHAETSGGTEGRARLLREAQSLARLSHPNVVQIHDIGEHRDQVYVAMEFVDGTTLDVWQRAAGRTLAEILRAYHQAGEGLFAAHRAGLVHRDFKPDNVLVGDDGRVRVADFGLARRGLGDATRPDHAPAAPAELGRSADASTTAAGAIVGTPAYMAPEQFQGVPTDARGDIFSFCAALWEALHGERPFAGHSVHELALSVTAGARRRPARELPARLQRALERGLAVDPDARWPTMEPLLAAIAVDPEADPSSAARQRRIFTAVVMVMSLTFLSQLAGALTTGEAVVRRWIVVFGVVGVGVLAVLLWVFRGSLLRNRYHRGVLTVVLILALVSTSQRVFGVLHGAPLVVIIVDTLHIVAAITLTAALLFVRWMGLVAIYCVAAIVLAYVEPRAFPGALLFFLPLAMGTMGYFWRRDAIRGTE